MSRPKQGFCSIVCAVAVALGGGCGPSRSTQDPLFDPHESCLAEQERLRAERDEKISSLQGQLDIIQDDLQALRRHAERLGEELAASRESAKQLHVTVDAMDSVIKAKDAEIRELKGGSSGNGQEDLPAQLLRQKQKEIDTLRAEIVRLQKGEPRPDAQDLGGKIIKVAPDVDLDRPVAEVDGEVLTRRDLAEYLYADLATRQLLDPFVNRQLVLRAASRAGMSVTDAEVEAFVVREVLEQIKQAGSEAQWLEKLGEMGYERRGWESRLRYQARPMLLLGRLVERERETPNGRDAFEQRIRGLYEQAYSVRVSGRQIFFAVPPDATPDQVARVRRQADQAYQLLLQGHGFANLAQQISQDPDTRRLGGYMGEFGREALKDKPELEEAFFKTLREGQPSQPIRSRLGFHLLLVDERRTPQRTLDESLRRELAERLRGEPATPEEQAAVINRLRSQARIRTALGIAND